jgi:methylamine---glutamate N-methyltransferase subunit C
VIKTSVEYQKGLEKTIQKRMLEWAKSGGHPLHREEIESIASTAATGKYASKGLGATLPQHSRNIDLVIPDDAQKPSEDEIKTLDERLGLTIGGRFSNNVIHSNIGFIESARSFGSCTLADKIAMHFAANILYLQHGMILVRNTGEGGALPWELFGKSEARERLSKKHLQDIHDFTSEILEYNFIRFDTPDLKEQFIDLLFQRHYPLIVQVASGMFWSDPLYLELADAIEMKQGQGAKTGHGGLLPGHKVDKYVAKMRGIPIGIPARSPSRLLNNLGPENNTRYVLDLLEACDYDNPVIVKEGASQGDASTEIVIKSYADAISICGLTGGTGAAPRKVQNEIGITTEAAAVMARRAIEGYFEMADYDPKFKVIMMGGLNDWEQVLKIRPLGADGAAFGTAFMGAANCIYAMTCDKNCKVGITTNPELYPIIDNAFNIVNFVLAQAYKQNEVVRTLDGMPTKDDLRARTNFTGAFADIAGLNGVKYHDKVLESAIRLADTYKMGVNNAKI